MENACEAAEDLVAPAEEQGIELSDDQLDSLSGGDAWYEPCLRLPCIDFRK